MFPNQSVFPVCARLLAASLASYMSDISIKKRQIVELQIPEMYICLKLYYKLRTHAKSFTLAQSGETLLSHFDLQPTLLETDSVMHSL